MNFLFLPCKSKNNPINKCMFRCIEDMLDHLNNTTNIRQAANLTPCNGSIGVADLRIEPCDSFSPHFDLYSFAVYAKETLIGYSTINFLYNSFKTADMQALSAQTDSVLAPILSFAEQNRVEKCFFIAGKQVSVYEWLDSFYQTDIQDLFNNYLIKFRAVNFKMKCINAEENSNTYFWCSNFLDANFTFAEFKSSLDALTELVLQKNTAKCLV